MSLIFKVVAHKGYPQKESLAFTLEQHQATIGRGENNSWILPDPDCYVSAHHATIEYREPHYYITDTSSNGVFINNSTTPLGKGNTAQLTNGDRLGIGDYTIAVELSVENADDADSPLPDVSGPIDGTVSSDDPFAFLGLDPIGKIIEESPSFGLNWDSKAHEDFPKAVSGVNPKKSIWPETASDHAPSIDEAFIPNQDQREKRVSPKSALPENWWEIGKEGDTSQERRDEIGLSTERESDRVQLQSNLVDQTPDQPLDAGTSEGEKKNLSHESVRQFLEGAGLSEEQLAGTLEPDSFFIIGKALRAAVQGARDALMVRAKTKKEMYLDVTTIRPDFNNPIKFSFSVDEALNRLLSPQFKGYMPPVQAIQEVYDDITAHQIAVLAGMQTALQAVLRQFDPTELKKRLQQRYPISANIPIHGQAKLWNLFEQRYAEIGQEAEDNFYYLFGQAFSKAYEEQIQELKRTKSPIE